MIEFILISAPVFSVTFVSAFFLGNKYGNRNKESAEEYKIRAEAAERELEEHKNLMPDIELIEEFIKAGIIDDIALEKIKKLKKDELTYKDFKKKRKYLKHLVGISFNRGDKRSVIKRLTDLVNYSEKSLKNPLVLEKITSDDMDVIYQDTRMLRDVDSGKIHQWSWNGKDWMENKNV